MCSSSESGPPRRTDAGLPARLLRGALVALCVAGSPGAYAAESPDARAIRIPASSLSDALRQLARQTGMQLVYEQGLVSSRSTRGIDARLTVGEAMDRLLSGSDLRWRLVDGGTIAIFHEEAAARPSGARVAGSRPGRPDEARGGGEVSVMPDVQVTGQAGWWMQDSSEALGFARPLIETPRSVTSVNGEAIELFGLSAVEDLLRIVPGVFTTTRFGVQGSVDIRAVPADSYFRGMKRLTLQGHGRSVLAAMDSIEVVAGPPPPIYGLGKIGGYTNVVPKSGRARTGRYLDKDEGFAQLILGSYDRREASFGFGGPVAREFSGGRDGGYYIYGLIEDSGSYTDGVPVKQRLLQVATSIDEFVGPFRLETGVNVQQSVTAGALIGRLTQALVDDGTYLGGTPLVDLDVNGNGRIGYLEMARASPVAGALSATNQPLNQVFAWPVDASGKPLPLGSFPVVPGIPKTLYDYLQAHPEADPGGLLRAQGVGGPTPLSGSVPIGMALDPRTVHYGKIDLHRSPAFERKLDAVFATAYFDLIDDADPARTRRNQLFFDGMDQYKSSNQPFSQVQKVLVVEDKYTMTQQPDWHPAGLGVATLLTANLRNTISLGRMTLADYGNHRGDALDPAWNAATGGMTPNATFTSSNEYPGLDDDGLPWASVYRTQYMEVGVGGMLELKLPRSAGTLTLGARYDLSHARNTNYAGRFNYNTGNAVQPGAFVTSDDTVSGWDGGPTWSVSYAAPLPGGFRPYATVARASLLLDGNNNTLANSVIINGHVGSASLNEAGLKGAWLSGSLTASASAFEQGRVDVDGDDDVNVINAYATSTTTRGWQAEVRWSPTRRSFIGAYAVQRRTRYTPDVGGTVQVDARALGFQDVLDADGNVVYPAEAFLYGGRARIVLPDGMEQYSIKQGNPETQYGLAAVQAFASGWGATLRSNYLSSTCSGRLCLVRLPSSVVTDVGVFVTRMRYELKLDVFNVGNTRYFRARTGDTLGDVIAQALPGRRWQLTAKIRF